MTTFTDKELIKEIRERIGSPDVRDNIERPAYEIALASLEAVAWMIRQPAEYGMVFRGRKWKNGERVLRRRICCFTDTPDHAGWIYKMSKTITTCQRSRWR